MGSSIGEEGEQQQYQPQQQDSSGLSSRQSFDTGHAAPEYGYVTPQNDTGWWSSANGSAGGPQDSPYGDPHSTASYGQAPMFSPVAEGYIAEDANGLMSPMNFDNTSFAQSNQASTFNSHPSDVTASPIIEEAGDDELGLGNASAKRKNQRLTSSEGPSTQRPGADDRKSARMESKKGNDEKSESLPRFHELTIFKLKYIFASTQTCCVKLLARPDLPTGWWLAHSCCRWGAHQSQARGRDFLCI